MASNLRLASLIVLTVANIINATFTIEKRTGPTRLPSCVDFTPFVYSGCFVDGGSPRTLLYKSDLDFNTMTVEKCVAFCKGNGYRHAGLTYYGECRCGASVNGVQIDESNCRFPCTGNDTQACGGNKAISIYQDPTFKVVDWTTIDNYMALGCYSEGPNGRTLGWKQSGDGSTLTIERCLTTCRDGGYAFAGVEFGKECYCGVVLGNGTMPLPASECNVSCSGNPNQSCGGRSKLNLYVDRDLESTEPCGYTPPVSSSTLSTSVSTSSFSTSQSSETTTTTSSTTSAASSSTEATSSSRDPRPTTTSSIISTSSTLTSTTTSTTTSSSDVPSVLPSSTATTSSQSSSSSTLSSQSVTRNPSSTTPASTTLSTSSSSSSDSSSTYVSSSSTSQTPSTAASTVSQSTPLPTTSCSTDPLSNLSSTQTRSSTTTSPTSSTASPSLSTSARFTSFDGSSSSSRTTLISTTNPTTSTPSSACVSTYTVFPPLPKPTCEYKLGKWCAKPLPEFDNTYTCLKAFSACVTQLGDCFRDAGYPDSLRCNDFNQYCSRVASFCGTYCPGPKCSIIGCRQVVPSYGTPSIPGLDSAIAYTSTFDCASKPVTTTSPYPSTSVRPYATTSTGGPIPTGWNLCTQPVDQNNAYGPANPVGGYPLPNLSCNNDYSSFKAGFPFKLYTSPDPKNCRSYQRTGPQGPRQGCIDACDEQYKSCMDGFANPYNNNYESNVNLCKCQKKDCYAVNANVGVGTANCMTFDSGY